MQPDSIYGRIEFICTSKKVERAITFVRNGDVETHFSYGQLLNEIDKMANLLHNKGVIKGRTVVLCIDKSLFSVVAYFALHKIGAICVPLNPEFKKAELTYLLEDADPVLLIIEKERHPWVSETLPEINVWEVQTNKPYKKVNGISTGQISDFKLPTGKDPALIIYTSGTTGHPKGAVLTHNNLLNDAENIIDIWQITDRDVLCHSLPLFHIHGLCFALQTTLLAGGHVIMLDQFHPEEVIRVLSQKGETACSMFMAVPAMYTKIMDILETHPVDFSHLRILTSGSAPLLKSEFERIIRILGKAPVEREGMSETGMNFSNPLDGERKPGSIGLPLPGVNVRVVNTKTAVDVTPGQVGEFWLKSSSITSGYWRKPRETAAAFEKEWFKTGDLGFVDANGYYYLTDRIKHIIITGGENVSAKEVETVINLFDGVKESAVVGIPDKTWGEKIVAAVTPEVGKKLNVNEIKQFCKARLHDWKCPKDIHFFDEIPKNTMGKVLKSEIKHHFITSEAGLG